MAMTNTKTVTDSAVIRKALASANADARKYLSTFIGVGKTTQDNMATAEAN